ncbi:MAG: ROK family protein [Bacteroidales bacterium]|nr:ROK family protein [Bacteroidales bacterium]
MKGVNNLKKFFLEERSTGVHLKKQLLKNQLMWIFYKEGNKSISELCSLTNNSIPTITNIIIELTNEGWVLNYGISNSTGGRKPTIFGLNPNAAYILGIDLSRRYTNIGLFDLHNNMIGEMMQLSEGLSNSDTILPTIKEAVDKILNIHQLDRDVVLGSGVAIPGIFNIRDGVSYSYPIFGGSPVKQTFEELLNMNVYIEHDTRTMALGEQWFGLAGDYDNALFINIGSGIGLSMILNGELYKGRSGYSGEFGHIQMVPEGDLCYCGRIGCLETVASGTAIVHRAKEMILKGKNSIISRITHNNPEAINLKTVISAANSGDLLSIELLEEAAEFLAKGVSTLIHLFNPDAVIIGGEMAEAGNLIKDPVKQKIGKYTILQLKQDSQILVSGLHERAGILGTLPVVMSNTFYQLNNQNEHIKIN